MRPYLPIIAFFIPLIVILTYRLIKLVIKKIIRYKKIKYQKPKPFTLWVNSHYSTGVQSDDWAMPSKFSPAPYIRGMWFNYDSDDLFIDGVRYRFQYVIYKLHNLTVKVPIYEK